MPRHELESSTMQANVRTYYQQFEEQQTQSLIDQRIKEHLGQAAAFQHVGAAFNQHLMAQRPRLPNMPIPGAGPLPVNQPMVPGMRPPVLARPVPGAPGYAPIPGMPPPMMAPPCAPLPGQVNSLPRPPTLATPTTVAATATTPTSSNGTPATSAPYQANN
ncbi:U1 small nuclear ribonucleoprotein C-like [Hibiscus syriacus]|uniref:U1 small nuclear ribonucleoprotein C-like n=1 Tax=Hibiscus syriacus TaxID=106335 RepID=UPI001923F046|nr:U1 small nuclear ribonucleoprotein C-like [Hibiscus syriacus]